MELYCQKCLKQLELDESLLDIDQSLLLKNDKSEILPLVKELQQLSLKFNNNNNNSSNNSISTLSSKYIDQPIISSSHHHNHINESQQRPQTISKFKSGFFNRNKKDISQSVPTTPILPLSPPPKNNTNKTNNSSISSSSNNEQPINTTTTSSSTQPIGTTSFNVAISSSTSSSPPIQSFGSLSQHRLTGSTNNLNLSKHQLQSTTSASSLTVPTSSSVDSNSSNSSNNSSIDSRDSNDNDEIEDTQNSQPIKINFSSSVSSSSLTSTSTTAASTTSNLSKTFSPSIISASSSSSSPNDQLKLKRSTLNLNRSSKLVQQSNGALSPNQNSKSSPSKQRLKYLRSSSKSLSLASLPEPVITSPNTIPQNNNNINNNNNNSLNENIEKDNKEKISPPQLQQQQSQLNFSTILPQTTNNNNNINNNNPMNTKKYIQSLSLFKITTELIKYDLPLCLECTKIAITELEEENENLNVDQEVYKKYSKELDFKEREYQLRMNTIDSEIEKLEEDESYLKKFLEQTDMEREKLSLLSSELDNRAKLLESLELQYWSAYSELHYSAYSNKDDHDSVQVEIKWVNEQLEQLKQTSILNDAFHLWYDGHFGTINSLRLGKLPSQPVDWNEINAAWGLAISLLDNMAKRLKFKFSLYNLIPNGSCSRIEKKDDPSSHSYELYGSNDISLGRLFWYRRFDNGMVAFLHCIKELCDHIKSQDREFYVPYQIEKENIGGHQIKMQFSSDDVWTKSLKFMLTNLKYLLIWVTKYESTQSINGRNSSGSPTSPSQSNINNSQSDLKSK